MFVYEFLGKLLLVLKSLILPEVGIGGTSGIRGTGFLLEMAKLLGDGNGDTGGIGDIGGIGFLLRMRSNSLMSTTTASNVKKILATDAACSRQHLTTCSIFLKRTIMSMFTIILHPNADIQHLLMCTRQYPT